MPRTRLSGPLAAGACALALVAASAGQAHAAGTIAPKPLPARVSAPYVDTSADSALGTLAQRSGSHYLSLAFLQATAPGSCELSWNGEGTVASGALAQQIAAVRAEGGDVIPSFGGEAADTKDSAGDMTDIAESCTDVAALAAAYEQVVTTYDVTRLDLDVEQDALDDTAAIDRRNQAIAEVEAWAKAAGRTVQFSYTLPTSVHGLSAAGLAVLRSAARNGAVIHNVDIMTFDYWDGVKHDMVADAETAAAGLVTQLKRTLYPSLGTAALYRHVGIVQMAGIDDYGPTETFRPAQARRFEKWAAGRHLAEISFWSLGRDNGRCVGTKGSSTCSGVKQRPWAFSKAFAPFTG